jgi:hypothetical protein
LPTISDNVVVAVVAVSGALGAAIDLRSRRVPNWLTLGITLTGLTLAVARVSGLSLGAAFAGLALGLAVMLPGHLIGATGAGDVKFLAALGTACLRWPSRRSVGRSTPRWHGRQRWFGAEGRMSRKSNEPRSTTVSRTHRQLRSVRSWRRSDSE